MAAVRPPRLSAFPPGNRLNLLFGRVLGAESRLDVFQCQLNLVVADLLRASAELGPSQNRDDVIEAFVLRGEPVDLGGENLAFMREARALGVEPGVVGPRRQDHCLQHLGRRADRRALESCLAESSICSDFGEAARERGCGLLGRCGLHDTTCVNAGPVEPLQQCR
jgi:hypothetical protein